MANGPGLGAGFWIPYWLDNPCESGHRGDAIIGIVADLTMRLGLSIFGSALNPSGCSYYSWLMRQSNFQGPHFLGRS